LGSNILVIFSNAINTLKIKDNGKYAAHEEDEWHWT